MSNIRSLKKLFHFFIIVISLLTTFLGAAEEKVFDARSDSFKTDAANQIAYYIGNAILTHDNMLIKGEQISAKQAEQGNILFADIIGAPASLKRSLTKETPEISLTAKNIHYDFLAKEITAKQEVHFTHKDQKNKVLNLTGNNLLVERRENYFFSLTGNPVKLSIISPKQSTINANAEKVTYNEATHEIQLSGNVFLHEQQNSINAALVKYNLQNGQIEVPKTDGERVKIIQKKSQKK